MAKQAEFPWQVAILTGGANFTAAQSCGGSLVGTKYVVTAAHCTVYFNSTIAVPPAMVHVGVGFTSLAYFSQALAEGSAMLVKVSNVANHPGYAMNFANDISVLTLAEEINLSTHPNIKPICLPAAGEEFANAPAVTSGWGRMDGLPANPLDPNQVTVADLRDVPLTVYPPGQCAGMNQFITSEGQLCAGTLLGGKNTCAGDSGGPLIAKSDTNNGAATLVGAVSFGTAVCAAMNRPTVYTNVSYYRGWLDSQMPDLQTCPPPETSNWMIDTIPNAIQPKDSCQKDKILFFKIFKKIRGMQNYNKCADKCNKHDDCEYFNYVVSGHKLCKLYTISEKPKSNAYSGAKYCNQY